ncbi:DivIVA domain-containing protein [Micromonospora sp. NPDC049523]|uniref:DivIVA domain-containing protein n=1 Tax=Micromonospora sp. NPDC049523 TaxID=3155921 RepID=UPI00341CF96A
MRIVTSAVGVSRVVQRLTRLRPEQVRLTRFRRTRIGRRGLAEEQVYAFVRRVTDELVAREATEAALREENLRLKEALRAWHTEQARHRPVNTGRWTER